MLTDVPSYDTELAGIPMGQVKRILDTNAIAAIFKFDGRESTSHPAVYWTLMLPFP